MSLSLLHQFSGLVGTICYCLLLAFCLFSRRTGTTGLAISLAVFLSLVFIAVHWLFVGSPLAHLLELFYLFGWILFLTRILRFETNGGQFETPLAVRTLLVAGGIVMIAGSAALILANGVGRTLLLSYYDSTSATAVRIGRITYLSQTLLSVCGLVMLEQVIRNGQSLYQWRSRLLNIAVAGVFGYALVKGAVAVLFRQPQAVFDSVQGMVLAMLSPLFVLGSLRNRRNPLRVNVSHAFVFQSGTLLGIGLFLFALGLAGYYARLLGNWALALFALFATGLILGLAVFGGSQQLRRRLRVIIAKTFFEYRYDYREQWLQVTRRLGESTQDLSIGQRCIQCMSEVLQAQGGAIYLRPTGSEQEIQTRVARLSRDWPSQLPKALARELDAFYGTRNWVIDLTRLPPEAGYLAELHDDPAFDDIQFVIPLYAAERFQGVCLLAQSPLRVQLNWEDYDLLKLIANQAGQTLVLQEADRSLRESRQFQAFNQVSAFVAHDVKTVTAQLKLLHRNAQVHRDNPAFVDDMLETIENTVQRMENLQAQLRQQQHVDAQALDLRALLETLALDFSQRQPKPEFRPGTAELIVHADRDRLSSALTHLINNAIDATDRRGSVTVSASASGSWVTVAITDTGTGMSETFINDDLFQPFTSTKGLTGMGIGAYQAREYVRSNGGELEVESTPGVGTTFLVRLPLEVSNG
ncbi:MAG: XrtA/PEP-CTERM system histidine kinase PrsK [Pseudomonadota bacterium]